MSEENVQTLPSTKTVAVHTLGCRLNFSETGSIAQGFVDRGYEIVPFGEKADINFINTCTVTDDADSTCRSLIRKAFRSNPEGKIVVAGCYAQMDPQAIAQMQGVDLILGTQEKYKVFDYLADDQGNQIHIDQSNDFWGAKTTEADSHTRAFLKIQDGCNYICSFCIIPFARGRSRTISIQEAIIQAKELVRGGFKEIVLTGVNIGEYESTSGEKLENLVSELVKIEGLERLRLSSVEPNTITDELLLILKNSKIYMDHFHIPLQSGDDQILKNMRRKYDRAFYAQTMTKIKSLFPNAGIGADIIVGFPGETEEQFQNTKKFLTEMPITHFHVFPFSKRKNTTAAKLENHIPHHIKKQRVKELITLGEQKLQEFALSKIGSTTDVLFERKNAEGLFTGYSSHFIKVKVDTDFDLNNQILKVAIESADDGELRGKILS